MRVEPCGEALMISGEVCWPGAKYSSGLDGPVLGKSGWSSENLIPNLRESVR